MTQLIPTLTTMSLLDYLDSLSAENLSADLDSGGASGMFVFGQKLISTELSTGDGFGESVIFDNNVIYVGMPGEDGVAKNTQPEEETDIGTGDLFNVSYPMWENQGSHTESFSGRSAPFLTTYGVWANAETTADSGQAHVITRDINVSATSEFIIRAVADATLSVKVDNIEFMNFTFDQESFRRLQVDEATISLAAGKHTLKFTASRQWPISVEQRRRHALPIGMIYAMEFGQTSTQSGYWAVTDSKLWFSQTGLDWQLAPNVNNFLVQNSIYGNSISCIKFIRGEFWVFCSDGVIVHLGFAADAPFTTSRQNPEGREAYLMGLYGAAVVGDVLLVNGYDGGIFRGTTRKNEQFQWTTSLKDNVKWAPNSYNGYRAPLYSIASNGVQFIACGNGTIALSSDGIFWDYVRITNDNSFIGHPLEVHTAVWFNDAWFVTCGPYNGVYMLGEIISRPSEIGSISLVTATAVLPKNDSNPHNYFAIVDDKLFVYGSPLYATIGDQTGNDWAYVTTNGVDWAPAFPPNLVKTTFSDIRFMVHGADKTLAFCLSGEEVSPLVSYDSGNSWQLVFDTVGFAVAIYPSDSEFEYGAPLPPTLWDTRKALDKNAVPTIVGSNAINSNTVTDEESSEESDNIESITVDSKNSNIGQVVVFKDAKENGAWTIVSEQQPGVDPGAINSVFLFNTVTNSKVETLDFIDPAKGRILGVVEQAIDFKTCFDPAYYNVGITPRVQPAICWGPDQVGKIWWDLSTVAWLDYEQGEFAYRSANWGKLFPGSDIRLYVWTESAFLPSQFLKTSETQIPRDINDIEYVELSTVDRITGAIQTRYFYWVTDIGSDAAAIKDGLSLDDMKRMIESPQTSGVPYAAFVSPSTVGMWNISDRLVANEVALHVSYDIDKNDSLIHSEFQLVQEGSAISELPKNIITKIIDSLCGFDTAGNAVPDPTLSDSERYGISFRPRQGVFLDAKAALRMFIAAANKLFTARPLLPSVAADSQLYSSEVAPSPNAGEYVNVVPDTTTLGYLVLSEYSVNDRILVEYDQELDGWAIYSLTATKQWVRIRSQAYNATKFWSVVDWYAAPAYAALTKFSYVVDMDYEVQSLPLVPGHTVKVKDTGGGKFRIYYVDDSGDLQIVGVQAATIAISERLWLLQPRHEVRFIIAALLEIFEKENVLNDSFFALVRFALSEQKAVDWVFKTSFITVLHKIRNLAQYATYQKDNQDFVREFINEVKPYRTKIREYLLSYSAAEIWDGVVTDFDLPGYYDVDFNRFRSPSGEHNKDAELYELEENTQWSMHHTYYVGAIDVVHGGSGYSLAPQVEISGGGGTGATAYAQVSNGVVRRVVVSSPGTGYYTAPKITIAGITGSGAKAIARLANDTTRKISTTIKFDRTTYDSSMIDWEPNTLYKPGTVLTYAGVVYKVQTLFQSSGEFDANYMTLVDAATMTNANDRTMGFYQPKAGMISRDLGQLFTGIDYPGMKLQGAAFDDTQIMEIGVDGTERLSTEVLDEVITSAYRDAALGTRPEDINIQGGAYVDMYSSHAPEELIPGIIFDAMDIQVFTRPAVTDLSPTPSGADIRVLSFAGNNTQRIFDINIDNFIAESCIVYTSNLGNLRELIDYSYNIEAGTVELVNALPDNDMLYVYLMKTIGNNCIYNDTFVADGVTHSIPIPHVDARIITDSAILLNGERIYEYDIESVDNNSSVVRFANAPNPNAYVHIYLFSGATGEHLFSDLTTQYVALNASSPKEVTLTNALRYTGPLDTSLIVELNNVRLRPSDNRYYVGNGITTSFPVPTTGGAVPSTADISVWVNGLRKFENIEYSFEWIQLETGLTCLCATLVTIPTPSDVIVVSLSTFSEFVILDSNRLQLKPDLLIKDSSELKIISFSTHDSLKIQTRVFSGASGINYDFSESNPAVGDVPLSFSDAITTLNTLNEGLGFSMLEWDDSPFDHSDFVTPMAVDVPALVDHYDNSLNSNYIWVTVNGKRLMPNYDFMLTAKNIIILAPSLNIRETDCIVITTFALPAFNEIIGFRIFKNMLNEVSYLRISNENTTELAAPLAMSDTEIFVKNAAALPEPSTELAQPGVVFINGERITYYAIDYARNTLGQLRRGTGGTGAYAHAKKSKVVDASTNHIIPNSDAPRWNTAGLGLINSNTVQSNFIKSKPSFNPA